MSNSQFNWEDCKAQNRRRNNNIGINIQQIDKSLKREQQIKENLAKKPTSHQLCTIINLLNQLGDKDYIRKIKLENREDAKRAISKLKRLVEEKGIVNEQRAV